MIVGPTGGGKSVILETLKNARLASENVVVKMNVLNPKAQPLKELYGEMDPVTRDWTDGILSKLFREMNAPLPSGKENEVRWIIFDGDVDALWVENMNSVMDDNKLLTLPNGERIRLQPYCSIICETFGKLYYLKLTLNTNLAVIRFAICFTSYYFPMWYGLG
jgi:dynein heavy chain